MSIAEQGVGHSFGDRLRPLHRKVGIGLAVLGSGSLLTSGFIYHRLVLTQDQVMMSTNSLCGGMSLGTGVVIDSLRISDTVKRDLHTAVDNLDTEALKRLVDNQTVMGAMACAREYNRGLENAGLALGGPWSNRIIGLAVGGIVSLAAAAGISLSKRR